MLVSCVPLVPSGFQRLRLDLRPGETTKPLLIPPAGRC
jgi:hypothetical protein